VSSSRTSKPNDQRPIGPRPLRTAMVSRAAAVSKKSAWTMRVIHEAVAVS
jgi:hypothetical protein